MRRASIKTVLAAFGTMCLGAGLMALLGKWYVWSLLAVDVLFGHSNNPLGLRFYGW